MLDDVRQKRAAETEGTTVRAALANATNLLRQAGFATAGLDARLLVGAAGKLTPEQLISEGERYLNATQLKDADRYLRRRLEGEPVSRIVGSREFWGLNFSLSAETLDPRPESELLVEIALDHIVQGNLSRSPLRLLDLGTGSGCLLGALLSELPESTGVGVDISMGALATARANLSRLGLLERASFLCGSWADAIRPAAMDVVLSNPPYIRSAEIETLDRAVRCYDPIRALDGGEDGLLAYRALIAKASLALKPGGIAVFEAGEGQASKIVELMERDAGASRFLDPRIVCDLAGIQRAVARVRQS